MKFELSKVYTSVNADELKPGDKVITAQQLGNLKYQISQKGYYVWTIKEIKEDTYSDRFVTGNGVFPLVYLIERKENCTNCRAYEYCKLKDKFRDHMIIKCASWLLKTEPKTERQENCTNCGKHEDCGFVQNQSRFANLNKCENWKPITEQKAEKHYRPFRDVDELIGVWQEKCPSHNNREKALTMPLIWVRKKLNFSGIKGEFITRLEDSYVDVNGRTVSFHVLFTEYEFLDGSICGVEE